ncbi:MAG TPA: flagellar basal-body MS-ring/collar protein FliF [Nocardioides sp.]|nr:flagellar basal-body MS-ring/collar protein FliF [Nocardioides sp.]
MKQNLVRTLARYRRAFLGFSAGQKAVVVVGTLALVVGGVLVVRWALSPSYAPLYADLAPEDASAVVEHLDAEGIPYELSGGGGTIMVPRDQVYDTRIALSGEGLPSESADGYSLLDEQGLSTSEFQEKTSYKRAMEGELSATIESMDVVDTAVVHLAIPEKEVFADEQDPTTASVMIDTSPGDDLDGEQVQAIVHLVASSVDGLDPDKVTLTDASGRVLSSPDGSAASVGGMRNQQSDAVQQELQGRLQKMLDRVVGPNNSTVEVTAMLDFDTSVTETTKYAEAEGVPPLRSSTDSETYQGPAGDSGATGVVGPDGQMDSFGTGTGTGESAYEKESKTQDNAVNSEVERRETAPGAIENLHVGVVLDAAAARAIDPEEISTLVAATVGIDPKRGDTVSVSSLPFDRTAEEAAAEELAAAEKDAAAASRWKQIRYAGIAGFILLALLLAWLSARRRAKARDNATNYVVEQLRAEQEAKAAVEPPPATLALEQAEVDEGDALREELVALVERQPDDVAALLRGWLVDRP